MFAATLNGLERHTHMYELAGIIVTVEGVGPRRNDSQVRRLSIGFSNRNRKWTYLLIIIMIDNDVFDFDVFQIRQLLVSNPLFSLIPVMIVVIDNHCCHAV